MSKKLQDKINAAVGLTEDKLPGEVVDLGTESKIGEVAAAKQKKATFPTDAAGDTSGGKLEGEVQDLGSEDAGKNAAGKSGKASLPDGKGAGTTDITTTVTDPFTLKLKESIEASIDEELEISPEAKAKMIGIFEAAVIARTNDAVAQVREQLQEQFNQDLEIAISDMSEKVDSYLTLGVNTWKQDNELAIQEGIRTQIAESLMQKVLGVFLEHNITVPEGADDLVEQLNTKVDDLNEMYNETTKTAIALSKENNELKRVITFGQIAEGLADSEKDKLDSLVEGIEFENAQAYTDKVTSIKESYFGKKGGKVTGLSEDKKLVGGDVITESVKTIDYTNPIQATAAAMQKRFKTNS